MNAPTDDVSLNIAGQTIPLRARVGGILRLLAIHEATISSSPTVRLTIDCGPSDIQLSIQTKLGRQKVRR
jgi:hypothetical protein